MKRAAADGERPKEAAARLKMHPFYVDKLFRQAEAFSDRELDDATIELAELDYALKGGSRLAPGARGATGVDRARTRAGQRPETGVVRSVRRCRGGAG